MARSRKPIARGSRAVEVRDPKSTESPCILFSFKHFIDVNDVGQSLQAWAEEDGKLLLGLLHKMLHISKQTPAQATQDSTYTHYGDFPDQSKSDFTCPPHLKDEKNWGVIRNIGGQKARAAGYLKENIFYIVYLDQDHRFWKSAKP
jgi:rhodanese-related sulfurtransferase